MERVRIHSLELVNPRLVHLILDYKKDFKAGQFAMLKHPEGDVKRAFSIASSPLDERWEFVIRINEGGKFTPGLKNLKAGDYLEVDGPYGHFIFQEEDRETLFIAGGAGISPMRSMVRYATQKNVFEKSNYWLFYGVNVPQDFVFWNEFTSMDESISNFHFVPVVLEPSEDWKGDTGFVMPAIEKRFGDDLSGKVAYICGPPPMVKAVREFLESKGMSKEDIRFEQW